MRFRIGLDFTVKRGSLRQGESRLLIAELLSFAKQLEMEVSPINMLLTGMISETNLHERLGLPPVPPLLDRPLADTNTSEGVVTRLFPINQAHVQGVILCHAYEDWCLTWNLNHDGLLADYGLTHAIEGMEPIAPQAVLSSMEEFFQSTPVEVHGEFSEVQINIHCPWRRSDAAAACDALKIVSRHCFDFIVEDECRVWPDKDFARWDNLA